MRTEEDIKMSIKYAADEAVARIRRESSKTVHMPETMTDKTALIITLLIFIAIVVIAGNCMKDIARL